MSRSEGEHGEGEGGSSGGKSGSAFHQFEVEGRVRGSVLGNIGAGLLLVGRSNVSDVGGIGLQVEGGGLVGSADFESEVLVVRRLVGDLIMELGVDENPGAVDRLLSCISGTIISLLAVVLSVISRETEGIC